jgi:hypothetical protein
VGNKDVQVGRDLVPVLSELSTAQIKRPMHIFRLPRTPLDRQPSDIDARVLQVSNTSAWQEVGGLGQIALEQQVVVARDGNFVSMWKRSKPFRCGLDFVDLAGWR